MRRRIQVRGEQRKDLELERLAHALLRAAREATKVQPVPAEAKAEARRDG